MPRYKPTFPGQIRMIPIDLKTQLSSGSFEFTLDQLIENHLDISIFDHRYKNDITGASAYDPRILLKVILMAYSRGVTSSRVIEKLCLENIIFMALSRDSRPHCTAIASFISRLPMEMADLFSDVLTLSDEMGLIGKEMFAMDGCKIPSTVRSDKPKYPYRLDSLRSSELSVTIFVRRMNKQSSRARKFSKIRQRAKNTLTVSHKPGV